MNRDIYQTIKDRFVEQLRKGTVPWQKPWQGVQNIVSRKQYRGINSLLVGSAEFQSPFWLTFKQAPDLGGHVKKGAKSTPVIYYKFLEKTDAAGNPVCRDDGTPKRIPFVRWSNVFNLDQTEGIEPPAIKPSQNDLSPNDRATAIVQKAKVCPIHHTGFAALYSLRDDVILSYALSRDDPRDRPWFAAGPGGCHRPGQVRIGAVLQGGADCRIGSSVPLQRGRHS
jgi:antirestriction protein ArdC